MWGYFLGLIPGVVLISITRGFGAIFTGISQLFFMTGEAASYTVTGMLRQTLMAYVQTWPWIEITFFMLVLSMLAFLVLPTKLTWLKYTLTTIIAAGFCFFLYKKDLFTRDYRSYGSIYRFGALILSIMLITFIIHAVNRKNDADERILAFAGVVIIAITPIGSNNDIYTNINNMFFVMPLFLWILVRFVSGNEYFRGIRYSVLLLTLLFVFQSIMFGCNFTFRDGDYDNARTAEITGIPAARGMMTTVANKEMLEAFMENDNGKNLSGKGVLLYGDVSGLGFYLQEKPVISTAWPSLDSFSTEKFEADIKDLEDRLDSKVEVFPAIIVGDKDWNEILNNPENKKQSILKDFISKYNYTAVYTGDKFTMLTVE